ALGGGRRRSSGGRHAAPFPPASRRPACPGTLVMATPRIAAVQHGDYAAARRLLAAGQPEPYFGMGYTLRALDGLFRGRPHLVVSLDAPAGETTEGEARYVGLPRRPSRFLPASLAEQRRAAAARRLLDEFRPTHLLLRTGGLVGLSLLKY